MNVELDACFICDCLNDISCGGHRTIHQLRTSTDNAMFTISWSYSHYVSNLCDRLTTLSANEDSHLSRWQNLSQHNDSQQQRDGNWQDTPGDTYHLLTNCQQHVVFHSCSPDDTGDAFTAPVTCVRCHERQILMSSRPTMPASVFLILNAVSRAAPFWYQHSFISFDMTRCAWNNRAFVIHRIFKQFRTTKLDNVRFSQLLEACYTIHPTVVKCFRYHPS